MLARKEVRHSLLWPDCRLPNATIRTVARIDKATANHMLSSFLNASTPAWKLGVSKTFSWPSCVHRVKGAPDLLTYLNNTLYASGCAPSQTCALYADKGEGSLLVIWNFGCVPLLPPS